MRWFKILGFVVACVLASASTSQAQVAGKWGLGGFLSYTNPVFTFGQRFGGGVDKWGMTASYVSSSRMTIEAEYHHAQMGGGILESGEFSWSPKALTSKQYRSKDINPNSSYTNRFNSVLLSGLWFFNADRSMDGEVFRLISLRVVGFTTTRPSQKISCGRVKAQPMPAVWMRTMWMPKAISCLKSC